MKKKKKPTSKTKTTKKRKLPHYLNPRFSSSSSSSSSGSSTINTLHKKRKLVPSSVHITHLQSPQQLPSHPNPIITQTTNQTTHLSNLYTQLPEIYNNSHSHEIRGGGIHPFFQVKYPKIIENELKKQKLNNFSMFMIEKYLENKSLSMNDEKFNDVIEIIDEIKGFEKDRNGKSNYIMQVNQLKEYFWKLAPDKCINNNNNNNSSDLDRFKKYRSFDVKKEKYIKKYLTPLMSISISFDKKKNLKCIFDDIKYELPCRSNYFEDCSYLLAVKLSKRDCIFYNRTRSHNKNEDLYFENFEKRRELIYKVLSNGIYLMKKKFVFLNPSSGGFKTKICYFYQADKVSIINKLLFDHIVSKGGVRIIDVMKFSKRRSFAFSKCIPSIIVPKESIKIIQDVLRVDDRKYPKSKEQILKLMKNEKFNGILEYLRYDMIWEKDLIYFMKKIDPLFDKKYIYNFTDGSGLIGKNLLIKLIKEVKGDEQQHNIYDPISIPSVIQIHLCGSKGTLLIDNRKGFENIIHLRESQIKYDFDVKNLSDKHRILEILSFGGQTKSASFNIQLIQHLNERGIPVSYFTKIQNMQLLQIQKSFIFENLPQRELLKVLKSNIGFQSAELALRKILSGFSIDEPSVQLNIINLKKSIVSSSLQDEDGKKKKFCRIKLYNSTYHMGVVDPYQKLSENQIFVQLTNDDHCTILHGKVILAKMPLVHPSDIVLVDAVEVDELKDIHNAIVFNSKGRISLGKRISRSDYDGDRYLVIWDNELVSLFMNGKSHLERIGLNEKWKERNFQFSQTSYNTSSFIQEPVPSQKEPIRHPIIIPKVNDILKLFVEYNGDLLSYYSELLMRYIDSIGYIKDNEDYAEELYNLIQELLDMKATKIVKRLPHFEELNEKLGIPDFLIDKYNNEKDKIKMYNSEKALGCLYRNYQIFIKRIDNYRINNNVSFNSNNNSAESHLSFISKYFFTVDDCKIVKRELCDFCQCLNNIYSYKSKDKLKIKLLELKNQFRERFLSLDISYNQEHEKNINILYKKASLFYKIICNSLKKDIIINNQVRISFNIAVKYIDLCIIDIITEMKGKENENYQNNWMLNERLVKDLF